MIKQIQLRGISRSPSDRMTSDGGCSESLNVITDQTELAPMPAPKDISSELGLPDDFSGRVLYVHSCGGKYRNVIALDGTSVVAYLEDGTVQTLLTDVESVGDIKALGNILMFIRGGVLYYFLFTDGVYQQALSGQISVPEIEITTGGKTLAESTQHYKSYTYTSGNYSGNSGDLDAYASRYHIGPDFKSFLEETFREKFYNDIVPYVKKYRAIRYSCLLFDGSEIYGDPIVVKHFEPECSFDGSYVLGKKTVYTGTSGDAVVIGTNMWLKTTIRKQDISLKINNEQYSKLSAIKNIVTGIRLYASSTFGKYQNPTVEFVDSETETYPIYISESGNLIGADINYVPLPEISFAYGEETEDGIADGIKNLSDFRLIKEWRFGADSNDNPLNLEDDMSVLLEGDSVEFPLNDILETLPTVNYEQEYSPSINSFSSISVYNNKLLGVGSPGIQSLRNFPHSLTLIEDTIGSTRSTAYSFTFEIVEPVTGEHKITTAQWSGSKWWSPKGTVFGILFFPDANCRRVYVTMRRTAKIGRDDYSTLYIRKYFDMKEHPLLSGYSYVLIDDELQNNLSSIMSTSGTAFDEAPEDTAIGNDNRKLYVSEMNNPFIFTAGETFTFDSEIMGIATTTKALSQGQFGQYPLYVFTKDGIWSMETGSDGSFVSKKPLSRDVALSAECITQIEQAIVFTTDKGVMLLSGSDIKNISPFMTGTHYRVDDRVGGMVSRQEKFAPLLASVTDDTPFMDFMRSARCAYDYTGQRLIFFNNDEVYQYVYKIDTDTWHKMSVADSAVPESDSYSVLNSYPDCWVGRASGGKSRVLDFSTSFNTDAVTPLKGIVVTRPFDLDEADVRKAIKHIRIRGGFNREDVKYVLLASMDGHHWGVLPSLRGGSYKLFRMVLFCDLEAYERISYIDIEYETRFTNRLR